MKKMKGIYVNGIEHKITQFADDTTLILDGSKDSLIAALNLNLALYLYFR